MVWFTWKTLDFRQFYLACKCVFWSMLWAEWLHSSVHGGPGESPWGGTVSSGEQRQPEYSHWGTECVQICVCMQVRLLQYNITPCIFSASVLVGLHICNHLHLLSSSVSFLPPLPPPHSFFSVFFMSFLSHILPLSTSLVPPPSFPASPLPLSPPPSAPHLFMREYAKLHWLVVVWWWRQSDLEQVTNEVSSSRRLPSMTAAAITALIYVAQPCKTLYAHKRKSHRTYTHRHVHRWRLIADGVNGMSQPVCSPLVYIYRLYSWTQDALHDMLKQHTHRIVFHICTRSQYEGEHDIYSKCTYAHTQIAYFCTQTHIQMRMQKWSAVAGSSTAEWCIIWLMCTGGCELSKPYPLIMQLTLMAFMVRRFANVK